MLKPGFCAVENSYRYKPASTQHVPDWAVLKPGLCAVENGYTYTNYRYKSASKQHIPDWAREEKRKKEQIEEIHFVKGDTRGVAAQDKNEFYNSVVILLKRFCRARIHH